MAEQDERAHDEHGALPPGASTTRPSGDDPSEPITPPTGQVRISAVEAAVAAGLAPSTKRVDPAEELPNAISGVVELPDWTDPPTGQVPRVLLDEDATEEYQPATRGPSWRQDSTDWDELDLSIFVDEEEPDAASEIAGQLDEDHDESPFDFGDLGLGQPTASEKPDDEAWVSVLGESDDEALDDFGPRRGGTRHARRHRRSHARTANLLAVGTARKSHSSSEKVSPAKDDGAPKKKNVFVASATGLVVAGVAIACFFAGAVATLVLATVVVAIAAGEAFAAGRRVGLRPAVLPGLVAVALLVIGAYLHGASAIPFVLALAVLCCAVACLAQRVERPAINIGATLGIVCWVGVLGAFAGLLLAPSAHPKGHGVALVVGAIALTVAHDIGSYAVGSRLGRHPLAPALSPHKTIEGLAGGTVATLLVAALVISRLHPFHLGTALELGVLTVILAPVGDLFESAWKRDLGIKDMGNLLPGHGGFLDRIDALLFVLPATYYLASVHHLA